MTATVQCIIYQVLAGRDRIIENPRVTCITNWINLQRWSVPLALRMPWPAIVHLERVAVSDDVHTHTQIHRVDDGGLIEQSTHWLIFHFRTTYKSHEPRWSYSFYFA